MSLAFDDPRIGPNATFAGGEATLGDIASASVDQMLYVDNTLASQWALDRAISERNDEVFAATGVRPELPFGRMRMGTSGWRPDAPDALAKWQRDVETAAARIPDQNVVNRLTRSIEGDAIRIARDSDARLARLMASRGGAGKWVAALAGGAWGSMADPINVVSMLVGGGPGAGRTVAGRILATAAREAAVNGATEAAMQPMVQAWRAKAGLDHGVSQALTNVGFAAAFGGALGGAGQALGEGMAKLSGRALDAAGAVAAQDERVAEPLRRTMQGDVAAARETLPEIRAALPAEARGALDHAEVLDHLEANRPASALPEHHDLTVSAAHRAIDAAEPARFSVDPAQVERITSDMVGPPPVDAPRARSLVEFLKDRGGVLDQDGELAAIGAADLAKKGKGKDRRAALDAAREAAEEAGYIGRAGETQVTTVADLLDAIDTELRGNKVYAREDAVPAATANFEAQRAGVERTVAEIAAHAGPAVDDRIVREAAELAIGDGMDPFDALESVLTRAEPESRASTMRRLRKAAGAEGAPAIRDEPMPGWSDADLDAASAARGPEPTAEKTAFFDPAQIDPDFTLTANDLSEFGDVMLPGANGAQSLRALVDDIRHGEGLAAIVKACKA